MKTYGIKFEKRTPGMQNTYLTEGNITSAIRNQNIYLFS